MKLKYFEAKICNENLWIKLKQEKLLDFCFEFFLKRYFVYEASVWWLMICLYLFILKFILCEQKTKEDERQKSFQKLM